MYIYFFLIIVIGIGALLINSTKLLKSKRELLILVFSFLIIFLLSALRNGNVGKDTEAYLNIFDTYLNGGESSHVEIGYSILNKIVANFITHSQGILIVGSFLILMCLAIYIYINSKNVWLSIHLYISMYFLFFSFNYMRQFIAIGLVLISINYAKEKKIINFVLLILIASTFHTTALFGIFFYFIYGFKYKKYSLGIVAAMGILYMLFEKDILKFIVVLVPRYEVYLHTYEERTGGTMIVFLHGIIFLGTYLLSVKTDSQEYKKLVLVSFVSFIFSLIASRNFMLYRPAIYYQITMITTIPNVIYYKFRNPKLRITIYYLVTFLSVIYLYYFLSINWHHVLPYKLFMW